MRGLFVIRHTAAIAMIVGAQAGGMISPATSLRAEYVAEAFQVRELEPDLPSPKEYPFQMRLEREIRPPTSVVVVVKIPNADGYSETEFRTFRQSLGLTSGSADELVRQIDAALFAGPLCVVDVEVQGGTVTTVARVRRERVLEDGTSLFSASVAFIRGPAQGLGASLRGDLDLPQDQVTPRMIRCAFPHRLLTGPDRDALSRAARAAQAAPSEQTLLAVRFWSERAFTRWVASQGVAVGFTVKSDVVDSFRDERALSFAGDSSATAASNNQEVRWAGVCRLMAGSTETYVTVNKGETRAAVNGRNSVSDSGFLWTTSASKSGLGTTDVDCALDEITRSFTLNILTKDREVSGPGPVFSLPSPGVESPQLIRSVRPNYTDKAREAKKQGVVRLEGVVLLDGTVADVRVVRSLDSVLGLDQEAINAAKRFLFRPGRRFGEPVAVRVSFEIEFTLR